MSISIEIRQITESYGGSSCSNSGRCIYNLRLLHKIHLQGDIEIKCGQLCNGSSRLNGSLNPCDFYTDSEDYFLERCAWHVRAKRRIERHRFLNEESLGPEETNCLNCAADVNSGNCYVNVKHVVDELCARKAHLENEKRRGKLLKDIKNLGDDCLNCLGKSNTKRCSGDYFSMRDLYDFQRLFPHVEPVPLEIMVGV